MNRFFVLQAALPAALLGACASLFAFDATASGRMATALVPVDSSDVVVRAPAEVPRDDSAWTYLGPQRAQVERLAFSPVDPSRMIAVLEDRFDTPVASMMFESLQGGHSWVRDDGLGGIINDVALDAGDRALAAHGLGVFYRPAGQSWWDLQQHPEFGFVWVRRVSPAPGTGAPIWISAWHEGQDRIYRLSHDLQVWDELTPGLPTGDLIADIAVSPTHPGRVAVSLVESGTNAARVWITQNDGASWTTSTVEQVLNLSTLRWVGDRLFVGGLDAPSYRSTLWASNDFGASWEVSLVSATNMDFGMDVAGDPAQPGQLWAGTADGLYASTDGGLNWAAPEPALTHPISRLEYQPQLQQLWAARRDSGTWVSEDAGATWQPRNHRLGAQPVVSVATHPARPAEVAVAIDAYIFPQGQVATSDNGGLDWLQNAAPRAGRAGAVRVAPSGALYATQTQWSRYVLLRREVGGDWEDLGFDWPIYAHVEPGQVNFGATEDTLLVSATVYDYEAAEWRTEVWRSGDTGQTWDKVLQAEGVRRITRIERTLSADGPTLFVFEMSYDPQDHSRLWRSSDDGQTWAEATPGITHGYYGDICTGSDGQVLMQLNDRDTFRPSLLRSDDGGGYWEQSSWSPDWFEGVTVTAMHCPGDAQLVFLGGNFGVLSMSDNGGATFELLATDADVGQTRTLAIQLTPAGLYLGNENSLWANPDITLPMAGPKALAVQRTGARMRYRVTLQWHDGAPMVDIRHNGARVATTANTGEWSSQVLATSAVSTWQVCNAGTEECSAVVGEN